MGRCSGGKTAATEMKEAITTLAVTYYATNREEAPEACAVASLGRRGMRAGATSDWARGPEGHQEASQY